MRRRSFLIAGGTLAGGLPAAGPARAQQNRIKGAGASFPRAVYERWGQAARAAAGVELAYEAVGSVEGVERVSSQSVDFGASDAPRAVARLRRAELLQFPSVFGAVVPAVNLPGVRDGELKLTGELLADLFLGKVSKWNDARVKEHNPGLALPDLPVVPIHRSEGSGTTFVFTTICRACRRRGRTARARARR